MTGPERPGWDAARRALYLLRRDVAEPASTDQFVWPSLFDTEAAPPLPAWTGANPMVWTDLDRLRAFVAERFPPPVPLHAMVAVTWVSDRGFAQAGGTGPYRERAKRPSTSSDWSLLGFDVADGSLLSGLMNCCYRQGEVDALRERWESRLNEHHLLAAAGEALAFRAVADERVPEHAPFFVYGLYIIREAAG